MSAFEVTLPGGRTDTVEAETIEFGPTHVVLRGATGELAAFRSDHVLKLERVDP